MQEELNTRLLQKISYLEKGAVLGMIVCSCFFLAAILYFVKANVYVILISGLKKKVAHVRNKIKRKRVRRIGGKGKNEITNKAYFKLIVLAFVGVGSIYTYRTYYVEAAVITQLAIDEDTEVMDNTAGDIGEKSPKLYLESKGWIGGTGEFAQYLFSKDNRTFTIGVEENTFHSDLEKESFLFQVSEKESGIDQEGFNKVRQYEQGEFERKDSDNPIYQKTLSFETEKNRQKVYSLYLEYINRWGMPLIGDKGAVENYGNILSGTFKSKKLVIDKKCPEIAGLKLEKADKKKEGIRFAKKSVSETYNTDEIYNTDKKCNTDITYNIDEECYYNTSVKGMIDIREKYLDLDSIHIQAMPLDDRAREVVKENEAESNDGMLDILAWTHTKKGNLRQISFDFAVEGKWKFILDCADLAGNKGVSNQTGQEGIESTDVTIDKSAPELSVDYKGIINVMEAESSPANINKKLKSNGEKITSSGNELFMKRENSIDICIEDMNLEAENIELKLYRVKYGLNGKIEQNKESWEEITEKIKQEPEKQELEKGKTLDDILVDAFATVREAAKRVINEKPFYTQVLGALAIHYGNIAEMKTGEGKTLTSVMPAYLNALTGEGVHIITVNEYLASRDAAWMGQIFEFLGLTVGTNLRDLSPAEKRERYNCDILYSTNNEIGFDYLRDNMVVRKEDRVQRPLNFAIVDEVDSVLIDEARTPLIISGGAMHSNNQYTDAQRFVRDLKENEDFIIDEKTKSINLTDEGSKKCEKFYGIDNMYDIKYSALVHHINQALRANFTMKNEVDYVVQDGKVVIVDQFTGRLMQGRAFSEGLHQAIEAKEGVKINEETKTLATITFQNLFRMYKKLSGMTGTAKTEEEEFRNIYNMYVIQIPTNKPVIRKDMADLIFATKQDKYNAIIKEIKERHATGQPVLVGTIAIETSELISNMLKKERIKHEVLNAKNHAREAEIIAKAGEIGSVTIATNMAGRGTDIKLGEGVKELGGLCVIGTERHESRRIDNQLRGRAGRQGDPGYTQFFVSFEDDLMVRFGTDRFKDLLQAAGLGTTINLRSKTMTRNVETAQKKVEGNNFDIRKSLLQYDDVMGRQREIMYERRNEILDSDSIHESIINLIKDHIYNLVMSHLVEQPELLEFDCSEICEYVNENLLRNSNMKLSEIINKSKDEVIQILEDKIIGEYENKIKDLPEEIVNDFEKVIALRVIDTHWMEHINTMDHLKEGIGLRSYAQNNPLVEYTNEGFQLFDEMLDTINREITKYLLKAEIKQNLERKEVAKPTGTNDSKDKVKTTRKVEKIGRNSPCPCGSGKKYKQCCGK